MHSASIGSTSSLDRLSASRPDRMNSRLAPFLYSEIKADLVNGVHRPGTKLSVDDIKTRFGVSKQPVMEALRALSVDGLVEIIPQVGCRVASYVPAEVQDFFSIFAAVEAKIAALAAMRRSEEQVARGREFLESMSSRLALSEPSETARLYQALNRAFHELIYEMAQSELISQQSRRMCDLAEFLASTDTDHPLLSTLDQRKADHELILEAIAQGDPEAATAAIQTHSMRTVTAGSGFA